MADTYYEAVGRRKTAIARVRLHSPTQLKESVVNDKPLSGYFDTESLRLIAVAPLSKEELVGKFSISAHVNGGGIHSQAEAIRLGVARALLKYDQELRKDLKKEGFLKRDPRVKERRKFGLKKARKSPQWSKR